MTEKKPGEPDERDKQVWDDMMNAYDAAQHWSPPALAVLAAYREEIESRAKREGAREALDAIKIHGVPLIEQLAGSAAAVASDMNCFSEKERCTEEDRCEYHTVQEELSSNFSHIFELAIRALADQPEAEGKENPLYACNKCGYCGPLEIHPRYLGTDNCNYRAFLIPPQPPAKADALPLGHEFVACTIPEWKAKCGFKIWPASPDMICAEPEAAHGRKPE